MASGLLPKSPVSSSLCDEVPHIFIPKSHLEPREFLISSAKRLLQQYRPITDKLLRCRECPLSAGRLAFDAGVDRSYTSGLERQEENPTVDVLDRLTKTLDVSISEFFKQPRKGVSPPKPLRGGRRPVR